MNLPLRSNPKQKCLPINYKMRKPAFAFAKAGFLNINSYSS